MSDWLARVRPWLNALLVLLLMLPLARLTWHFFVAEEPAAPAVAASAALVRPAAPPQIDVSRLRQAALFGQANTAGPNGELPESMLTLKLQGVIAAGESVDAVAIFDSGDARLRAVRVGMAVQPNVVIKAVYKDRVVIDNNGRTERISLQIPPAIPLNSPPPAGGNPAYPAGFDPSGSAQGYTSQAAPGYGAGAPGMQQQQQGGNPPYNGSPGYNGPPPGTMGQPPMPQSWQTQ